MLLLGVVCGMILNGCGEEKIIGPAPIDQNTVNQKLTASYSDLAIQNAIIAQHTLFPYHFVNNSAQLNALGERDLAVLAAHFRQNPGKIVLVQGQTEPLLYQSRAQTVYEKLLQAGIPNEKIQIGSGFAGGEGIPSTAVIEILENAQTTTFKDTASTGMTELRMQ